MGLLKEEDEDGYRELEGKHWDTNHTLDIATNPVGFWVFELSEGGGLYDMWFDNEEEAREYLEYNEFKMIMLKAEFLTAGRVRVETEDHT